MNDELRERLARLDPMHSGVPTEPATSESSRQMLEDIMSTPTKEKTEPGQTPRRAWIGIAAVAALVMAVGGALVFGGNDETPSASGPPLELNAPVEDTMAICMAFSTEQLAASSEVAFEGTVTAVDGDTVTLTVDEWFRGGDQNEVILHAPQGMEALIGGIPFTVGDQYLISAVGGTVDYCGFSGPSTPELRAAYETAFAG